jgi:hypothetical protein
VRDLQEGARGLRIQVVDQRIEGILGARPVFAIEIPRRRTDVDVPHENHFPGKAGSFGVEPSAGTVHLSWPFAGTGMLMTPLYLLVGGRLRCENRQRVRRRRHGERLAGHHVDPYIGDDALHPELRIEPADVAARENRWGSRIRPVSTAASPASPLPRP